MSKGGAPEFLSSSIEAENFDEGTAVKVLALEHLPADIAERVPQGMLVKEYLTRTKDGQPRYDEPMLDLAQQLQNRQQRADEMFHAALPDLVVKSQFIVGQNQTGETTVFELQPKVDVFADATAFQTLKKRWAELTPAAQDRARQQLRTFVERAKVTREDEDEMLDLFGSENLVLNTVGELRFLDTNKDFSRLNSPELYEENAKRIDWIEEFLDSKNLM